MDTRSLHLLAAAEGPNLRAAATAASEGMFDELPMPRSVVIVVNEARARIAARATVSLATDARAPITVARSLPSFVGTLDLVIVLTDDPGDEYCGFALAEAGRRGASTVLVDPGDGPVRAAMSYDTVLVPRPAMSEVGSFSGYLGTCLAALTCAGVSSIAPARVLSDVADTVELESVACSPERDRTVNPAWELSRWMRDRSVIIAGDGGSWAPIAELCTAWLLDCGRAALATELSDVLRAGPALTSAAPDIFHDPMFDDPVGSSGVLPLGTIVLTSPARFSSVESQAEFLPWMRVECPALEGQVDHPLVHVCVTAARMAAAAVFVTEED
ncbi:hypothetical protein [Corynebacterium sputi]|uniref:hypothetical protein n=1 Tax=Corynebacterium sputi TaxID=489915 RepID=UPI0012EB7C87|nr:hypothetical protein [Corynebacterium sputi]